MTSEAPYRSFSAGDLVLSCDPWVWALGSWDEYSRYCAFCFAERQDLRTCSKCKLHRYCDAKCQMADWKQEHKVECTLLGRVGTLSNVAHGITLPDSADCSTGLRGLMAVILMSKIALKLVKNTRDDLLGLGSKTAREILDSLPCYPENARRRSFFDFEMLEKIHPSQLFLEFNPFCSQTDYVNFVRLIECNAFPVMDPGAKQTVIGAAVIPQAPFRAMTPVCWDSNVLLDFRGRKFVVHATEDIAPYTGVTDLRYSEILGDPSFLTTTERRRLFQDIYNRPCDCRKCTSTYYEAEINPLKCVTPGCTERIPSDERALVPCAQCGAITNPDRLQQVARFVNKLETIRNRSKLGETDKKAKDALETALREEIDSSGILHDDAHIRFLVGWHGIYTYQNEGCLAEAWELSKAVVSCVRKIIPRYHSRRAYFLLDAGLCLGQFLRKLRDMEKAPVTRQDARRLLTDLFENSMPCFELCKEAWEIYRKIYGEDSQAARGAKDCHELMEAEKCALMKVVRFKV